MNAFDMSAINEMVPNLNQFGVLASMLGELEKTSSKTDKVSILKSYLVAPDADMADEVAHLLNLAMSPYIRYGVAKLPPLLTRGEINPNATVRADLALSILGKLSTRSLTGDKAKEAISIVMALLPENEADAFSRVLLKDLKAGVDTSINKTRPGTVDDFACQLAPSELAKPAELVYPLRAEPKWDGYRLLARRGKDGALTLLSRNGIPMDNFEELETLLLDKMPLDFVFDGEILGATFSAIQTRAKADRGTKKDKAPDLKYVVFDGMTAQEFDARKCKKTLAERRAVITEKIGDGYSANDGAFSASVVLAHGDLVKNEAELGKFLGEQLALGLEGAMVKSLSSLYTFKRNAEWQKLKVFETIDLVITGAIEGEGEAIGSLGSFICEGDYGDKHIISGVGPGKATHRERDAYWQLHLAGNLAGTIIECKYQEITIAKGKKDYALRFGTFVRERIADAGGKI